MWVWSGGASWRGVLSSQRMSRIGLIGDAHVCLDGVHCGPLGQCGLGAAWPVGAWSWWPVATVTIPGPSKHHQKMTECFRRPSNYHLEIRGHLRGPFVDHFIFEVFFDDHFFTSLFWGVFSTTIFCTIILPFLKIVILRRFFHNWAETIFHNFFITSWYQKC